MTAVRDQRVRRMARRHGHRVHKARQQEHGNNFGEFMLVDERNIVVLGVNFDANLDEIESYLTELATLQKAIQITEDAALGALKTLHQYLSAAGPSDRDAQQAGAVLTRYVGQYAAARRL